MAQQPSHLETLAAVHRSYRWLHDHDVLLGATSPHGLSRALEWLIAAWICEQCFDLGTNRPLSRLGGVQVVKRLNTRDRSQAFDELLKCDALRVVLAHCILARHGIVCDSLEAFVSGLAASLPLAAEDTERSDDLFETQLLNALTGLGQMPRLPSLNALLNVDTLDLLQADLPTIHRVASQVIGASAYGTREPDIGRQLRQRLTSVMSVWLLDFARGYQLNNVALVMRLLTYLGEGSATQDGMRFLLAQLHPLGHFGFFGPEAARARRLSAAWDEVASLQMPMTFACLWALSECSGTGFRLLGNRSPSFVGLEVVGEAF